MVTHITEDSKHKMESATILAAHAVNENMWGMTEDNSIGSLVDADKLVCFHATYIPFNDLDDGKLMVSGDMPISLTAEDFITDDVAAVSDQSVDSNEGLITLSNNNHHGYTALERILNGLQSTRNH